MRPVSKSRSPSAARRLSSFEELEASLVDMQKEYAKAVAAGDRARATACRRAVIQAKDRARLISRNPKVDQEKRKQKEEMVEVMLVWLGESRYFRAWVAFERMSAFDAGKGCRISDVGFREP